jgi:hypothetical protein
VKLTAGLSLAAATEGLQVGSTSRADAAVQATDFSPINGSHTVEAAAYSVELVTPDSDEMTTPWSVLAVVLMLASLVACGRTGGVAGTPSGRADLECVAYARQLTGLQITGDAWTWWDSAAGRYERGNRPRPMAVLVLKRTGQLPGGHVAVVRYVAGTCEIRVDHANWDDRRTRGRIYESMSVIDVSPNNDWTAVKFWNGTGYGKTYAAHGFIENGTTPARLAMKAAS